MNDYDRLSLEIAGKNTRTPSPALPGRREFLKRFGGGLLVCVAVRGSWAHAADAEAAATATRSARPVLPSDFNAFLHIAEDGKVTGFTGKIEMGQGPITSLAQMLAEDLEVPYESVDFVMGDTDLCPWDAGTWGSMTTRFFGPPLRAAAAEAKAVLLMLAATALAVPVERLVARDGAIFDRDHEDHRVT